MASTSWGTIEPPNTRAKASPTVDSSLRSNRLTRPMSPPASLFVVVACASGDPRRVSSVGSSQYAWYRPGPTPWEQQNSENRITAGQRGISSAGPRHRAVWGTGARADSLARLLGRVAEWHTRWLQVPVSFSTWGFKSPFAHNHDSARGSPREPRHRRRVAPGHRPGLSV